MSILRSAGLAWLFGWSDATVLDLLPEPEREDIDPNDPYTWDTQYIEDHVMTNTSPDCDSCIFYNSGMAAHAVKDGGAFDKTISPFKCFTDRREAMAWYRITSRAFAEVCKGKATFLVQKGHSTPAGSIWNTEEYDAIQRGDTGITEVVVIDPTIHPPLQGPYDLTPGAPQNPAYPVEIGPLPKYLR
ncbi:MAG: hypothetical protein M1814_005823 [Vezdaea aestivalis]|nr:MAG: hypothetical protein M1814_005823 [Vezdaea aestivalis]